MPSIDQLKQKYNSVLTAIQTANGHLMKVNMEGDKLLIRAAVANEDLKNQVWNQIKAVDASYSDLTADIQVDSALKGPAAAAAVGSSSSEQTYTVQPGDNLSKIAKEFYGNASEFNKIFEANRNQLENPDKIKAGMQLKIPA